MSDKINEKCIPHLFNGGESILSKMNRRKDIDIAFFYLFWRIKEAKLDDALIHLDDTVKEFWDLTWNYYERSINKENLQKKLTDILVDNFTQEEIMDLSRLDSFALKVKKK